MVKVKTKDARTTSFWYLFLTLNKFTYGFGVSITYFEQVVTRWEVN